MVISGSMNAVAEPLAKHLVVDMTKLVMTSLFHELVDVLVVFIEVAEITEEVIACYKSIVILIHK